MGVLLFGDDHWKTIPIKGGPVKVQAGKTYTLVVNGDEAVVLEGSGHTIRMDHDGELRNAKVFSQKGIDSLFNRTALEGDFSDD